jgi:phosphate-selective porin OprO/OprP
MRLVTQLLVTGSVPIGMLASSAGAAAPTTATENQATPAPSGQPVEATPAPTGDPILDRLNQLEARVRQLEARNAELEEKAKTGEARLEAAERRSDKAVQFGWGPSFSDLSGDFTFKPRGVIDADVAAFVERRGGYDYNNGTAFRRARIGFEGTALKTFNYRIEVDFAGNEVNLTDAYLQYVGIPKLAITLGQHKAPFGLESNNSDNYNVFMERGMFTNAFGNAGAERRIGASVSYAAAETLNASIGVFGDNESIQRSTATPVTDTPDESWGVNGRVTWEPIFDSGRIVHLGASGFYRTSLKSGDVADAVRLNDRPNIRIDNGNIADSGVITGVQSLRYDWLDLSDTPVLARAGNKAESLTLGLNWYLNPYAKLHFNWVRFSGDNTPLDPLGDRTKGDALATRLHLDF